MRKEKTIMALLKVKDFAEEASTDFLLFERVLKSGGVKSAELIDGEYYADEDELVSLLKANAFAPPENYILLYEYARSHELSPGRISRFALAGWFKTALKYKYKWYIDKNEHIFITGDRDISRRTHDRLFKDKELLKGKITAAEYAKMHGVDEKEIIHLINVGLLKGIQPVNRWYFVDKDEPFVHYMPITSYAQKYNLNHERVYSDILDGKYKTAVKTKKKWFIVADEQPK